MTSREAAERVSCPVCWAEPGKPCTQRRSPWQRSGPHHQRLERAQRKTGTGRAERLAELAPLTRLDLLALALARLPLDHDGQAGHRLARLSRDRLIGELLP